MRKLVALMLSLVFASSVAAQTPAPAAPPAPDPENILYLDLSTGGRVGILMRPDKAPKHVERIKTLTRRGFYDGLIFHRVIEGFMAQTGDPKGVGVGGSDLPDLKAEFNDIPHMRGVASMARTDDPDSANSQFFIVLAPSFILDGTYTAWGRVFEGMQYVDAIERGEPPANPSKIIKASIGADRVPPPPPAPVIVATPAEGIAPSAAAVAPAAPAPVATAAAPSN